MSSRAGPLRQVSATLHGGHNNTRPLPRKYSSSAAAGWPALRHVLYDQSVNARRQCGKILEDSQSRQGGFSRRRLRTPVQDVSDGEKTKDGGSGIAADQLIADPRWDRQDLPSSSACIPLCRGSLEKV